jgi:hypothetical protein
MDTAQEEQVRRELLNRAAEQSFRTLLGGPLAALVSFLTLHSQQFQAVELLWAATAACTTASAALWCRKQLRNNTITLWRFRAVAGLAAGAMIALPAAFHPAANSRQAALEVVTVAISTIVLMIMLAADRLTSYAALAIAIIVSVFTLSVVSDLSPVVQALSAVAVFFSLSPLIETVYQPLRKNIELLFTNEGLVADLQRANAGLSVQVVTDSLTGLANRFAVERALENEREVASFTSISTISRLSMTHGDTRQATKFSYGSLKSCDVALVNVTWWPESVAMNLSFFSTECLYRNSLKFPNAFAPRFRRNSSTLALA